MNYSNRKMPASILIGLYLDKTSKMKLILLGTGAARPDPERAPPSQVIIVDDEPILIDCGGGASINLTKVGITLSTIQNILLTHLHIDHCVDYPSIIFGGYLTGRTKEVNVFGPKGVINFSKTLFNSVYSYAAPLIHRAKGVEINLNVNEVNNGLIYETQNWEAICAPVIHGTMDSLAFRINSKGKSIVISGDTEPCENLIKLAKNADILVHECSFPDEGGERPGHTIPSQVGEIASEANVKKVVLTHLFPPCKGHEIDMIKSVQNKYSGDVIIGEDFMELFL